MWQTDRETNISKRSISAGEMYSRISVEWGGDHLIWSWPDINRSTFNEDTREKRFLHFRSQ